MGAKQPLCIASAAAARSAQSKYVPSGSDPRGYAARTRNGFSPSSRQALFRKFKGLETAECPFVNLPEARSGRWGEGLTAEKMKDCVWLKPILVAQFEFLEWTPRPPPRAVHAASKPSSGACDDI